MKKGNRIENMKLTKEPITISIPYPDLKRIIHPCPKATLLSTEGAHYADRLYDIDECGRIGGLDDFLEFN